MRNLNIAIGNSADSLTWNNKVVSWDTLCDSLTKTHVTSETIEQYRTFTKKEKNKCKDYGGFVGAKLKGNRRKASEVEFRSLITLDMDNAKVGFIDDFVDKCPYACFLYSTHGHRSDAPRYRLVFPLSRDINSDEFTAISRLLAGEFCIDQFDPCSFKIEQLMFWPSTPCDMKYIYLKVDKEWLNPDTFLERYPNWKDLDTLPRVEKENKVIAGSGVGRKAKDPLTKDGIVGAFNRTYTIQDAIELFLSDVYEPVSDNRYLFIGSSSIAGGIVYDNKFFYSHHAKDPAYGKVLDAFDLVKLHKFGEEKDSFTEMKQLALEQEEVKLELANSKLISAQEDFDIADDEDNSNWRSKLTFGMMGDIENTSANLILILKNDKRFKNIAYNQLTDSVQITGWVPWDRQESNKFWRDADEAQLIAIIDKEYTSFSDRNFKVAFTKVTRDRAFNPVKQYLDNLPKWDGVKRVERFLITNLAANDDKYTEEVTRKWFAAAVARIYQPGIKFDSILVLDGKQGVGKSTIIKSLVDSEYFSDSLQLSDMDDNKKAGEKIQGFWIIEIQELAGMKKADIEKVKGFISCTDDKYRPSYGKTVEWHPRSCAIFSTVNGDRGFLRDLTGNRRFWVVKINSKNETPNISFSQEYKDQIWAEAKHYYENGEELFLSGEYLETAKEYQNNAMEHDERVGVVEAYLNMLLPDNWDDIDDMDKRRAYIQNDVYLGIGALYGKATKTRNEVSGIEIWYECLKGEIIDYDRKAMNDVAMIMMQIPGWEKSGKTKKMGPYAMQRYYQRKVKD